MKLILAVVLCTLFSLSFSFFVNPKVLQDTEGDNIGSFIINLKEKADLSEARKAQWNSDKRGQWVYDALKQHSERTQKPIIELLEKHTDVVSFTPYFIANVIFVEAKRSVINLLASRSDIKAITSNRPFKVDLGQPDSVQPPFDAIPKRSMNESLATEWNIDYVKAPLVWSRYGVTGQGTYYANADTGVDWTHPALRPNYRGGNGTTVNHNYNWWDGVKKAQLPGTGKCGINSQVPCDDNSHGTHTTGTSVGQDGIGVAPGAKWIGCRNMDRGYGSPESYLSCLQFFLAPTDLNGNNPDVRLRPHAIGNSYGCTSSEGCLGDEFTEASEALRASGIFMSVSAGNSGPACSTIVDPPATEVSVITIGALAYKTDAIAAYSSRGPVASLRKPDLVAPGSSVRSCVPGGGYSSFSGTSMASPHVGAAVCLLTTLCPQISYNVDAWEDFMIATAKRLYTTQGCGGDTSSTTPNNVFGHGLLDIEAIARLCAGK